MLWLGAVAQSAALQTALRENPGLRSALAPLSSETCRVPELVALASALSSRELSVWLPIRFDIACVPSLVDCGTHRQKKKQIGRENEAACVNLPETGSYGLNLHLCSKREAWSACAMLQPESLVCHRKGKPPSDFEALRPTDLKITLESRKDNSNLFAVDCTEEPSFSGTGQFQ